MDEKILRRHFVAVATTDYQDPRFAALPRVGEEVRELQRWLCAEDLGARRFEPRYPELADNPDEDQIRVLKKIARTNQWRCSHAVVLYVTGHGALEHNTHFLVLHDSDKDMLSSTAVRTSDLIGWLHDTSVEHMMIILDLCYAGAVQKDIWELSTKLRPTWLVLTSVARDQKAVVGALTTAITQFLKDLQAPTGRQYGENSYIDAADFVNGVRALLGPTQSFTPLGWVSGPHPCLPNPHYRRDRAVEVGIARHDLALPRQDVETHWGPQARGVATDDQPGWLFTGRAALIRQLIAAASGPPAATLVTGGAGSGKSAVLARLVTLSDPQFLDDHAGEVAAIPADLRPDAGAVDVAVVATGSCTPRFWPSCAPRCRCPRRRAATRSPPSRNG
ncbi:P-loop NTPase family protein [Couchioplanes azureus]|uniref:ATP-binding protein n=1 Tax=Couchioplanes caeruleus TaxID=56438 RepID=UPI0016706663|nr:ATP-binding protein [Couchioplanes caeruleus]GGQ85216.1 hypothetical protein GCM10010166_64350 [Couchioplanes caeruleus subsp. azureus]